jgi:hypothetical protein
MARKKLRPEDEAAVNALREQLLLTIRFIEDAQDFPGGPELRGIVESAAAKGDLRTMRLLARETDDMTIALAPHEREGLEALLRERLGVDKDAERAELRRRVAAVIERGTVASERERRRLEDYAEMLEATGGEPAEIEAVRRLIGSG